MSRVDWPVHPDSSNPNIRSRKPNNQHRNPSNPNHSDNASQHDASHAGWLQQASCPRTFAVVAITNVRMTAVDLSNVRCDSHLHILREQLKQSKRRHERPTSEVFAHRCSDRNRDTG